MSIQVSKAHLKLSLRPSFSLAALGAGVHILGVGVIAAGGFQFYVAFLSGLAIGLHWIAWLRLRRRWNSVSELVMAGDRLNFIVDDQKFTAESYGFSLKNRWIMVVYWVYRGEKAWLVLLPDSLRWRDDWRRLCVWRVPPPEVNGSTY